MEQNYYLLLFCSILLLSYNVPVLHFYKVFLLVLLLFHFVCYILLLIHTIENAEHIIQNWDDILNYFKATGKIVLYTNLINTEMFPIDDNTIGINFLNGMTSFGKAVLSKKQNIESID